VLALRDEEGGVRSVAVSRFYFPVCFLANVLLRKNQSCDNCRNRKVRCAQTEEDSRRKRNRTEDGGSEKKTKKSKGKGKAKETDDEEDEAEWRRRMELRLAEMEVRVMARLDKGFRSLHRRMLGLEQLVDDDWRALGKPDPTESDGATEGGSEMDEDEGEDKRDEEAVTEKMAGNVAEDAMEE